MNDKAIAPAFIVSTVCAIAFCVVYSVGGIPDYEMPVFNGTFGENQLMGLLLFGAFGGLGTALILWAKHLFPQAEVVQQRHTFESTPEEQEKLEEVLGSGAEQVTRRKFLSKLAVGSLGAIGLASIFPLKSLGPNPGNELFQTQWRAGMRLAREDGTFIRPDDLEVGSIYTVFPAGVPHQEASSTVLIRVPADKFQPLPGRETWIVDGNVAYSKICTHVGCPVGLYRKATHELLCPCHQSTFAVLDGAKPVFGPAARPLPQLPLMLDEQGYLAAQTGYQEPIGPGFWNRGRKKMVES